MYKGICGVVSIYELADKFDFLNTSPNAPKIRFGTGYICTVNDVCYVVTCNHIMVRNSLYLGIYGQTKINMTPLLRIPELDIIVLETDGNITQEKHQLQMAWETLDVSSSIEDSIANATCISYQYTPDILDTLKKGVDNRDCHINVPNFAYNAININTMILQHGSMCCSALTEQPYYCFDQKFRMKGYSGSIIQANGINVAMLFAANTYTKLHYAFPLKYIDYVVRTMLNNKLHNILGISLMTRSAIFDVNEITNIEGQIVTKKSVKYQIADKKNGIYFYAGTVIEKVDDKPFVRGKLYAEDLGIYVYLNCYLFLSCLAKRKIAFSFYSGNFLTHHTPVKRIVLEGKPYSDIFVCPPAGKLKYIIWKNIIFAELTEQMYEYCSYSKLPNKLLSYKSSPDEHCIVCLVKNGNPLKHLSSNVTLYQINKVYNKKISNLANLKHTLHLMESKSHFCVSMTNLSSNNKLKICFTN